MVGVANAGNRGLACPARAGRGLVVGNYAGGRSLRRARDGGALHASADLSDVVHGRLRSPSGHIHGAGHEGWIKWVPGGTGTLSAVRISRLPVVAADADRPQAARA